MDTKIAGKPGAVIDIGTNSVKLLVASDRDGDVLPIHESSCQTRLGQGFYETQMLQIESVNKTIQVVSEMVQQAREWGAEPVEILATSAARDAINRNILVEGIQEATGIPLRVISGDQEALWAFQGVSSQGHFSMRPLLVADVGGGSTELAWGSGVELWDRVSLPVGSVRWLEKIHPSDPPTKEEHRIAREMALERFLEVRRGRQANSKPSGSFCFVGTGGTTAILARMMLKMEGFDRDRLDGFRIGKEDLEDLECRLWAAPLAERRSWVGLPPNRADVILMGTTLFSAILECFALNELWVSTRGMRFGAWMNLLGKGEKHGRL